MVAMPTLSLEINHCAARRPAMALAAALVALALAGCATTQRPDAALPAMAVPAAWSPDHRYP